MDLIELIMKAASIPSFSSYEERIHPFIIERAEIIESSEVTRVRENNLLIQIPGKQGIKPIALTAHLDKINHFGEDIQTPLAIKKTATFLEGQLDDAVGVGVCLYLMQESQKEDFPPLLFLLSEVEESYGLKNHPYLLKNNGEGLSWRLGAKRIATHLVQSDSIPSMVLTVDTTPYFQGKEGIALYSEHWKLTRVPPSEGLHTLTRKIQQSFISNHPGLKVANNFNDYLIYGEILNKGRSRPVPSLAIEPAIYPYHTIGERVFINDIKKVVEIIISFLKEVKP